MNPPPIPPQDGNGPERSSDAFETYHNIAETLGGLPTVRKKDNLIQGLAILLSTTLGIIIGWISHGTTGAIGLGLGGMILGLVLSGLTLMILGWVRLGKRHKR